MESITYEYSKVRRTFGMQVNFSWGDPDLVDITPDAELEKQWKEKVTNTIELDCIPATSMHIVNTERFVQNSRGTNHTDGAWPNEVKSGEAQERQRFLRKMTNEEGYVKAVEKLIVTAEEVVNQNATIDLYQEYFHVDKLHVAEESQGHVVHDPPSCKTLCVLRDKNAVKRSATSISWHPDDSHKLAVAYSILNFQQMPDKMPVASYVWDVTSPNDKLMELIPQSALTCLQFNPKANDVIVGGSYNGMLSLWDTRKGSQPIETTIPEQSHMDPVYDVFWIQSRSGNECVSVSTDGQVLWWDWRKMGVAIPPMDQMLMQGHGDTVFGGTCLEYKQDAGPTRYLVGTEQGQVLMIDRKAKKDKASDKAIKTVFGEKGGSHFGPVYSVQRNPSQGMLKFFLTVGDWSAKVWNEELKSPIMTTPFDGAYLTGAAWCPTRPGLFYTCKNDGSLDAWDVFNKHSAPSFRTKVSDVGLTNVKVQQHGHMVACGDLSGAVTVLNVSNALYDVQDNEKNAIIEMTERETRREKNIELKQAAKAKMKKEVPVKEAVFDPLEEDDEGTKAILAEIEEQFFAAINEGTTTKKEEGSAAIVKSASEDKETKEKAEADTEVTKSEQ